jgi:hypothetical protein
MKHPENHSLRHSLPCSTANVWLGKLHQQKKGGWGIMTTFTLNKKALAQNAQ